MYWLIAGLKERNMDELIDWFVTISDKIKGMRCMKGQENSKSDNFGEI